MFSRILMVLGLTFKSLIYLEIIFIRDVRRWPSFTFLHIFVQFSQHHLLNKLSSGDLACNADM